MEVALSAHTLCRRSASSLQTSRGERPRWASGSCRLLAPLSRQRLPSGMGCTGAPIIEVLRDAGPLDGFCLTSAACPKQARIASCALRRPTLLSDMFTPAAWRYSPRSGAPHRASGHRDGTESVCRNVKRWQNTAMALRWTAAGILKAAKGFRRLKAYKHLPAIRAALAVHQSKCVSKRVEDNADVA